MKVLGDQLGESSIEQKNEVNSLNQNDGTGEKEKGRDPRATQKVTSAAFDGLAVGQGGGWVCQE